MRSVEYEDSFIKIAGLIGGDEYIKVARALLNTEDTTDEEIASATGLRINIIRKVLYDMFGKALITGIRVKDEKKGWFVYRWRAKQDQVDTNIDIATFIFYNVKPTHHYSALGPFLVAILFLVPLLNIHLLPLM